MKKKVKTVVKRNAWSNGNGPPPSFTRPAGGGGRPLIAARPSNLPVEPTPSLALIAAGAHSVALTPPVPPKPPQTAQTAFGERRAGVALPSVSLRRPLARAPSPAPAPAVCPKRPDPSAHPLPPALPLRLSCSVRPPALPLRRSTSIHTYIHTYIH